MRSLFAARRGDTTAASEEIRRALELEPSSPELLMEAADLLVWMGRRPDGERLARRVLEMDPQNGQALRFVAELTSTRALGPSKDAASLEEALRLYDELSRREGPADPQVLGTLAQLRLTVGDSEGAIQAVRRLVEQRPGDAMATRTLAQLLVQSGKKNEALEVILRYLIKHPAEQELIGFVGQHARSLDEWELVDRELTDGGPYPASSAPLHRLQAEARLRLGRIEGATESLERCLESDPDAPAVRYQLGLVYRSSRRLADAAATFGSLVQDHPGEQDYALMLGQVQEDQGNLSGALRSYVTALEQLAQGEHAELRDRLRRRMAMLHLTRGEQREARTQLEQLAEPDQPEALELAARLAIAGKDWLGARQATRKLRTAGQEGLAALLEGECALAEKRLPKAQAKFAEAIADLGSEGRQRVAWRYIESGNREQAAAVLRDWVSQAPDDADARYYLGDLLSQAEAFEEAEVQLREAFRMDEEHGRAMNYLGYSLAERNVRLDEALDLVQRALRTDPWNGAYLDSLGWVFFQMGRYEDALRPLEQAVRELPMDPTVLEHLGDLYSRLGKGTQAIDTWTRALDAGAVDTAALDTKIDRERSLTENIRSSQQDGPTRPDVEGRLGAEPRRPR